MLLYPRRTFDREEVSGRRGVAATKHPGESAIAIDIMRAGGNAMDAAVAAGFAATVLEPGMVTLGGVGMLYYHEGATGRTYSIDFLGRAPLLATANMYNWVEAPGNHLSTYEVPDRANIIGHRAVCTPSLVAGLLGAHERFGRLPRQAVLEPAIALAEGGIPADQYLNWHIMSAMTEMRAFPETARIYLPGGAPPSLDPPALLVQRDLGATLRRIARDGRKAFYAGDVALAIEGEMLRGGGLVNRDDLDRCHPVIDGTFSLRYRDCEIQLDTNPTGLPTAAQTLNILARFDLRAMGHSSAAALHHYIEAARHAFADRFHYMGDPAHVDVPLTGLLDPAYTRSIASAIDPEHSAFGAATGLPAIEFASRPLHDPWPFEPGGRRTALAPSPASPHTHTTSFATADRDGNMAVCTETTGEVFGSKVTVPGTGIVLNDMMAVFSPRPGTANSIAAGKATLGSTTSPIVLRNARPFFAMGSPGGRHIMACGQQVMLNVIDHGMSIQAAISAPRVDPVTGVTTYDDRIDEGVIARLNAMGHRMVPVRLELDPYAWDFAQPTGVMIDDDGLLHAGADPWVRAEARAF